MAKTDPPRDRVHKLALALPDVEEGTTHGYPAYKIGGKTFAWFPRKKEVEDETLATRMSIVERTKRIAAKPDAYYVTPHYQDYPAILVRVWELSDAELRRVLKDAYAFMAAPSK